MNEETRIYNDDLNEFPGEENKANEGLNDDIIEAEEAGSKSPIPGYISLGVGIAAGLGVGIFGTHIAYGNIFKKDELPEEPSPVPETSFLAEILVKAKTPIASGINDEMSLEEAYALARGQVGPGGVFVWNGSVYGTYSEEEWTSLSLEQQNDYYSSFNLIPQEEQQATLFSDIQVSTSVNDDMSFGEAFAAARSDLGSGGVFMWQGNAYNTFYKEEWAAMTSSEKENFLAAYLEIPDSELIPTADLAQAEEGGSTGFDQNEFIAETQPEVSEEDYPIAETHYYEEQIDETGNWENEYTPIATQYRPEDDTGDNLSGPPPLQINIEIPMADLKLAEGIEDFPVNDDTALNAFIHQHLHQGQNAGQQHEAGDLLPDDYVADIRTSDDIVI